MSANIIIGIIAFLGFIAFIGYSIYDISSNTICDSSKCISPGGTWIKDKCTCSCNPGYSGNNCQTKSKNVSDLETACKDKTSNACANCLKTNITKKLSGNVSDVKQFKDDFISSITAINNICCQNNCSNTSVTACDNCVSDKMNQLGHIKRLGYMGLCSGVSPAALFSPTQWIKNTLYEQSNRIRTKFTL